MDGNLLTGTWNAIARLDTDGKPLYHVEDSETFELHSIGYEWLELA